MAIAYIPPSCGGNGSNDYNDLKNRPFYATKDTGILVDTTTVSLWEGGAQLPHFGIVEGEQYTITLDDVAYTAVAYFNEIAEMIAIGNIESSENVENENLNPPFFVFSPNEEETLIYISYGKYDAHTIKVEGVIETVVTLDEKYLPKSVAGKRNDNNSEIFNDHVNNVVYGEYAHSEGFSTTAHSFSHAEGMGTIAENDGAHAEGYYTNAEGMGSHSEGYYTNAKAQASHTEGVYTKAEQMGSHAEGYYTNANCQYQHVQGKYNIIDNEDKYAHIVGNGSGKWNADFGAYSRSNAHTLDWEGNAWFAGNVTVGENKDVLATEGYVNAMLSGEPLKITFTDEEMMAISSLEIGEYTTVTSVSADVIRNIVDGDGRVLKVLINGMLFDVAGMGGVHGNDVDTGTAITMQKIDTCYESPNFTYTPDQSCITTSVVEYFIGVLRNTDEVVFGMNGYYEYEHCTLGNLENAISNMFEFLDDGTLKVTLNGKTYYYQAQEM